MYQAGLVLEGGSTRGIFTAGVLDFLLERDVEFAYIVGVSAGSCNAVDKLKMIFDRSVIILSPDNVKEYKTTASQI